MTGQNLDEAIAQARRLLEESLREAPAAAQGGTVINVGQAGNVADTIHVQQQTQHIGETPR